VSPCPKVMMNVKKELYQEDGTTTKAHEATPAPPKERARKMGRQLKKFSDPN